MKNVLSASHHTSQSSQSSRLCLLFSIYFIAVISLHRLLRYLSSMWLSDDATVQLSSTQLNRAVAVAAVLLLLLLLLLLVCWRLPLLEKGDGRENRHWRKPLYCEREKRQREKEQTRQEGGGWWSSSSQSSSSSFPQWTRARYKSKSKAKKKEDAFTVSENKTLAKTRVVFFLLHLIFIYPCSLWASYTHAHTQTHAHLQLGLLRR